MALYRYRDSTRRLARLRGDELRRRPRNPTVVRVPRLVRAGGYVIYQDILDEPSFPRSEPDVPAAHQAWDLIFALFARKRLSPAVARDHGLLCHRLGWDLVAQRGKFAVTSADDGLAVLARLLAASERALLQEGLATEGDLAFLKSALAEARRRDYRYWFGPIAIETVAGVR